MMAKLDTWHKTWQGSLVFALIELGLAYLFASWAIDDGNIFYYLAAVILFIGSVRNVVQFSKGMAHDNKRGKAKKA